MQTATSMVSNVSRVFVSSGLLVLLGVFAEAHAQRTASSSFGTFLDEVGIMVDGAFVPGLEATEAQLSANPPLFENHTEDHLSVLMPDGTTPVRYSDIANVMGTLTVLDVGAQGTQVSIDVEGLLPGGLYTAWIDLYQSPGFTSDFAHELAVGALGYDTANPPANPLNFVGNVIVADAMGHAQLEMIQPAGPASWFTTDLVDGFEVPPYVLDSPVSEFHVVLAYHTDGMSWGPRPGAGAGFDAFDSTWVAYSGAFVPEPSAMVIALCCALPLAHGRRTKTTLHLRRSDTT